MLVLALAGCASPASLQAARPQPESSPAASDLTVHGRQLNLVGGLRTFEDEDFGELDQHAVFALDYCEPMELGPVRLEGGLHYSYDEASGTAGATDVRLKGRTFELSVGLNLSHLVGRVRPYVGLGAALLFLELRGIDEDADVLFDGDEATLGGYAKAGLLFQVTQTSHIGLEFRHFEGGDVTLEGTELDTSHDELLFVFGTSFAGVSLD